MQTKHTPRSALALAAMMSGLLLGQACGDPGADEPVADEAEGPIDVPEVASDPETTQDLEAATPDASRPRWPWVFGRGRPRADAGRPVVDAGSPSTPTTPADPGSPSTPPATSSSDCKVGPVPAALRSQWKIDAFYQKYADANGIPILASDKPVDKTLTLACQLVNEMVGDRPDVRAALIKNRARFTILGSSEKTTDPPEFSHLPDYYNTRARGLGGQVGMCAEESILCDRSKDRWYGESICVHEYAHTIAMYGLYSADKTFQSRLTDAFNQAKQQGLWKNTYASEQVQEYWAEGVQDWYNTNLESNPPNGVHGPINTKDELKSYDRKLYDLIDELLPEQVKWSDCYRRK